MRIAWSQVFSYSRYRDLAFGLCTHADRLYVVGSDEYGGLGKMRYRCISLKTSDGSVISEWTGDKTHPFATLLTCVTYGDTIYALGATDKYWSVLVFNKNLELLRSVDISNPRVMPFSAFTLYRYPNIYLYVGGVEISSGGLIKARVSQISATNLEVVNTTTIDAGGVESGVYTISYNNATRQIVAGGYVKTEKGMEWLLSLLTEDLKSVRTIRPGFSGSITGLAVDHDGYIYAIDNKRLVRISPDGRVVDTIEISSPAKVYATQDKTSPLAPYVVIVTENALQLFPRTSFAETATLRLVKETQLIMPYTGPIDSIDDSLYLALTRMEPDGKYNWYIAKIEVKPKKIKFTRV